LIGAAIAGTAAPIKRKALAAEARRRTFDVMMASLGGWVMSDRVIANGVGKTRLSVNVLAQLKRRRGPMASS